MRISDWSSDVCSSDLVPVPGHRQWRPDRKAIDDCRTLFAHLVLAIHARDIEHFGVLRDVRMFGAGIDAQVTHLLAPQRPAREHALDRLCAHAQIGSTHVYTPHSNAHRMCPPPFEKNTK